MSTWYITAGYNFTKPCQNQQELDALQTEMEAFAEDLQVRGLLILGLEGVNTTCACLSLENLNAWKNFLRSKFSEEMNFKDSQSDVSPFLRFKIKQREEIVTAGIPGVVPLKANNHHLSSEEWNQAMQEGAVVIDTRNWYEYKIGSFKGAVNPNIEKFTEFPVWLEKQGYKKEQKMLIFCTGGIRCEKGILELQQKGYDKVYQLDGGILKYLEERPRDQFEGECFVFDHRVAVDQDLNPSQRYELCPHCGNPADQVIQCLRCDTHVKVCEDCQKQSFLGETCSKNCAHWWEVFPGKKGARQIIERT